MTHTEQEIRSQPDCWRSAIDVAGRVHDQLPVAGERVAAVGCGTSWFMAQAYARLRESAGAGETDAFAASEIPDGRSYDRVLVLSRSGTTTEVLDLLHRLSGRVRTGAITAAPGTPILDAADEVVLLDFADERSVVQTRFATSALVLLRAHLGEDLTAVVADAERALDAEIPPAARTAEQLTFVGRGWAYGVAQEAALKMREASGAWTEAYPAMEYRHGPISITAPGRATWVFGQPPVGLADDVAATGGTLLTSQLDPLADLVRVQRLAVAVAGDRGLDPDLPRHLTRSVILTASAGPA